MAEFAWLIPLLPMIAAATIGIGYVAGGNRGEPGERFTSRVAVGASLLSLALTLLLDVQAILGGAPQQVSVGTWLRSGDITIDLSFTLDALGLSMTTLVALVSTLTLRFSVNYLHREPGFQRFFLVLSLFTGAMLLIVIAGNALLAFIGWELAGISSYLLIAYAYDRGTAAANATRVLVTNRFGDVGFIAALALSLFWIGSLEWNALVMGTGGLDTIKVGLIAAGFLLAAFVKSAQVPFSPWITRALEGPTPSSAIFYGAIMVHAGVYLVVRLAPVFQQVPVLMLVLILVGATTALYGLLAGLVQTDVKTALTYSTVAQTGLMFLACGLGWFTLAAWHLAAHAAWRSYQFLNAPGLMHLAPDANRPVPAWLQRRCWLYTAGLQRFWLDNIADWLVVRPTQSLARDTESFDYQVVNRLVGLPGSAGAVSSLAQWERIKTGSGGRVVGDSGDVGRASGALGRLMETIAIALHWFEKHLVLKPGDEGVTHLVQRLGKGLMTIESLLSEPRYLIVFVVITFVVIL